MTATRATYLDSSAIVKLAVAEPESQTLRHYLRRRSPLTADINLTLLVYTAEPDSPSQKALDRLVDPPQPPNGPAVPATS